MPNFMSIESTAFHNKSFQPPTTSHHSSAAAPQFSAYDTAMTTLRWRRSPNNPAELQSNARLLRWEDGSITLQLASNPSEQFEVAAKPLAPPQPTPRKPTPTSNSKTPRSTKSDVYDPQKDSFTFLAAPHEGAAILQVTNHLTTQLNVLPNKTVNDDAILKLQESLSAAVMKGDKSAEGGIRFIEVTEDPELQQKRAELAEKEKMKAQKRREAAEQRERNRATRVLNRSGIRSGGLSVGALEDDGMMLPTRKRAAPGSAKKRPSRRDRDDYDSDDDLPRGRTKEDEYDKEDDFVAGSDEELETFEGDDLEEDDAEGEPDGSEEEEEEARLAPARDAPSKEAAATDITGAARGKRRRVIEEDEDEDEDDE
jgi:RNA polymerase-associated protein LEO1